MAKSSIQFFFQHAGITLRNRTALKAFIIRFFKKEKKSLASLNYIFCSDKDLLKINQDFLDHDFYTDIITFNLSPGSKQIHAEVYISVDRVRANALTYKTSINQELLRVIFHGGLHLCGYKDKTVADKKVMRERKRSTWHYINPNVPRETFTPNS